jgi:hypothetical protein
MSPRQLRMREQYALCYYMMYLYAENMRIITLTLENGSATTQQEFELFGMIRPKLTMF